MKYLRLIPGLTALSLFSSGALAVADDWPQWKGPKRDGISTETGLLAEWPAGGPPIFWKATGLGGGYSTPSIANGRIFGMGRHNDDEVVWALDAKTGKTIWSVRVSGPDPSVDRNPGPRSTPTVDGELLYALSPGGTFVCLETASGKERSRKDFKQDFGGRMMSGWGFSESPLIDGNNVVCTPGGSKGTIIALNKKTGETVWQTKDITDRAAYSSIVPTEIGGVKQYVQITGESVVGIAPNDGRVLWRGARAGRTAVVPMPIIHDNHVYVTSGYNVGCNLFKITVEDGKFKAEEVYANKDMVNHHGGVVRVGEYLYGFSDAQRSWTCQEFKTGKVVWKEPSVGKGAIAYADGHLYLRSEGGKGTVALVEATPDGYKEKSRFDQPDRTSLNSWPHPVVVNGKLYIRDQDALLCYDVKKKNL